LNIFLEIIQRRLTPSTLKEINLVLYKFIFEFIIYIYIYIYKIQAEKPREIETTAPNSSPAFSTLTEFCLKGENERNNSK
jgi:hypothetical protein